MKKKAITIRGERKGAEEVVACRTKLSVGSCSIYVEGMDFKCPLCQVVVKSGHRHQCRR